MANEVWLREEEKFLNATRDVRIPNQSLGNVAFVIVRTSNDFIGIPEGGGCYWIWTTEPVLHSMHKNKNPDKFDNGEIIYNGIAKDNVRARAEHHLIGQEDANWSGISLDIYFGNTVSHRKKALAETGKVPFIIKSIAIKRSSKLKNLKRGEFKEELFPIRTKEDLLQIYISDEERETISQTDSNKIYFRNGIDITQNKHRNYEFRVYYITGLSSLYLDFIEKKWREDFGLPKLCSYSSGR